MAWLEYGARLFRVRSFNQLRGYRRHCPAYCGASSFRHRIGGSGRHASSKHALLLNEHSALRVRGRQCPAYCGSRIPPRGGAGSGRAWRRLPGAQSPGSRTAALGGRRQSMGAPRTGGDHRIPHYGGRGSQCTRPLGGVAAAQSHTNAVARGCAGARRGRRRSQPTEQGGSDAAPSRRPDHRPRWQRLCSGTRTAGGHRHATPGTRCQGRRP